MYQALGVCLLAMITVLITSSIVVLAALTWHAGGGSSPAGPDAAKPAILQSPGWITTLIAANAGAGLAALWLGLHWLRCPVSAVIPTPGVRRRDYFGAIALTLGTAPLADLASRWAAQLPGGNSASAELAMAAAVRSSPLEFALALAAIAIGPALAEELLFRGLLTSALLRYGNLAALLWPSILFGIYHLDVAQGVGTALLGLSFGWARLRTGSVVPSIVAHGVFNGAVLLSLRAAGGVEPTTATPSQHAALLVGSAIVIGAGLMALAKPRGAGVQ